jgi:ApaG protein
MPTNSTYQITVTAKSIYIPEQSDPSASRYFFAYHIKIDNTGDIGAQLLTRHWVITDSNEKIERVNGEGVVGEFPKLAPGESFEYTSAAAIETSVGTMRGHYTMRAEDGQEFEATIPQFSLSVPRTLH